jgi:hypothetical protein
MRGAAVRLKEVIEQATQLRPWVQAVVVVWETSRRTARRATACSTSRVTGFEPRAETLAPQPKHGRACARRRACCSSRRADYEASTGKQRLARFADLLDGLTIATPLRASDAHLTKQVTAPRYRQADASTGARLRAALHPPAD